MHASCSPTSKVAPGTVLYGLEPQSAIRRGVVFIHDDPCFCILHWGGVIQCGFVLQPGYAKNIHLAENKGSISVTVISN